MSYTDDLLIALSCGLFWASIATAYVVWKRAEEWDG